MPGMARLADKYAIVRSMRHSVPSHELGTHRILTGINKEPPGATHMASRNDWPCFSAGLQYLRPNDEGRPQGIMLPTYLNNGYGFCGQTAGFLGADYDPWHVIKDPNSKNFHVDELEFRPGLSVGRMTERRRLLQSIDAQRETLAGSQQVRDLSRRMQQAHNILVDGRMRDSFDIARETDETRDRYGRHMFGQSMLLARRLVESEMPIVQVNVGHMNRWDTHGNNFKRLETELLPPFEKGLSSLVTDLSDRGLLDETLIVVTGEFGRTPKINKNAGRDHWTFCYSVMFAGAGIRGGTVYGTSDGEAAYVKDRPISPADICATIYECLGIDPEMHVPDAAGQPVKIRLAGRVIKDILA